MTQDTLTTQIASKKVNQNNQFLALAKQETLGWLTRHDLPLTGMNSLLQRKLNLGNPWEKPCSLTVLGYSLTLPPYWQGPDFLC